MITHEQERPHAGPVEPIAAKTFLGVLHGRSARVTLIVVLALISSLAEAAMPIGLGWSVSAMENRSAQSLVMAGLLLAALIVLRVSSSIIGMNVSKVLEIDLSVGLKGRIGDHLIQNARARSSDLDVGEALETTESDTGTLAEAANVVTSLISSAVTYLVIGVYLLAQQWFIGVLILIAAPVLALSMPALVRLLGRRLREHRRLAAVVSAHVVDAATGLRTLKGISGEVTFLNRFYRVSSEMRAAGISVAGVRALVEGAKILVPTSVLLLILGVGILQLRGGLISAGQLVTFYGLALFLVAPVSSFVNAVQEVASLVVANDRVDKLLSPASDQGARARTIAADIDIRPGIHTVIVSTDVAVSRELSEKLGGIGADPAGTPQLLLAEGDAFLFSGAVRETLGDHSDDELLRALKVAGAGDIIDAFPDGLDHVIRENGRDLSGGQRQRLNLARAILVNPETLVLVDPTTAVDSVSELAIARRITAARAGRTTATFSQSPAHMSQSEEVILIVPGAEPERGRHRCLLTQSAVYRAIYRRETLS